MKVIRLILIMTVMLSAALSVSAQKKNEKPLCSARICIVSPVKQK